MTRSVSSTKKISVDKNKRRESLIPSKESDEKEHVVFSYHIKSMKKFVHWLNKNANVMRFMLFQLRKENIELNNEYNRLVDEKTRLKVDYQRMKKRFEEKVDEDESEESRDVLVESVRNISNVSDSITISDSIISKKLLDSSIFIDEKNSDIESWLSIMRNKLKENADWFSIKTSRKVYVRTRIDEDAMKYLFACFKKNSIKSFLIAKEIFDDLNRVFDDFNKKINVLKTYKRLKQVEMNKKFHTFWIEFQRLTSDLKLYDEEALLKNFQNKMFWDLQRILIFDIYKTIDLYEFARLCQFIDQMLRDMNTKFRNIREEYEESILRENLNNQESSREQTNTSDWRFWSEISKSNQKSNNREMSQVFAFDQVNAFICYNCDKSNHITRRCSALRKINLNSFVRKIDEDQSEENDLETSKKD